MFTGIIETQGTIDHAAVDGDITTIRIISGISKELKVDQSVAHNGVCLTVVDCNATSHTVQLITETINRSNFGYVAPGDRVNLERAMIAGARLDGHLVQGHVDSVGKLTEITDNHYTFSYDLEYEPLVVMKGSICVNGVSLTIAGNTPGHLTVALIPYTMEHTNFGGLKIGDKVNLEFDILGKYVLKNIANRSYESLAGTV